MLCRRCSVAIISQLFFSSFLYFTCSLQPNAQSKVVLNNQFYYLGPFNFLNDARIQFLHDQKNYKQCEFCERTESAHAVLMRLGSWDFLREIFVDYDASLCYILSSALVSFKSLRRSLILDGDRKIMRKFCEITGMKCKRISIMHYAVKLTSFCVRKYKLSKKWNNMYMQNVSVESLSIAKSFQHFVCSNQTLVFFSRAAY